MMVYRYDEENNPLFDSLGLLQERFELSKETRRYLGFLIANEIEILIDTLISDTYYGVIPNGQKNLTIPEMLGALRCHPNYSAQTDNQIVSEIIGQNANESHSELEKEFETEQGRIALKKLLQL